MRLVNRKQPTSLISSAMGLPTLFACLLLLINSITSAGTPPALHLSGRAAQSTAPATAKPSPAPSRWRELIGEYGPDDDVLIILEKDGRLCALFNRKDLDVLDEVSRGVFRFSGDAAREGWRVTFKRDRTGRVAHIAMQMNVGTQYVGIVALPRRAIEPESGNQLRINPVRPVAELMKEALAAQPPKETGDFRESDLVELMKLDPTIRLEIRYATTNNFLGTVFYSQARAFMQRPAAEAVARANQKLKAYAAC